MSPIPNYDPTHFGRSFVTIDQAKTDHRFWYSIRKPQKKKTQKNRARCKFNQTPAQKSKNKTL